MTDREKAVVMAYTGTCMLTGDKFRIFHKYIEDIMGRPVYTHELAYLSKIIRKKSESDFIALCEDKYCYNTDDTQETSKNTFENHILNKFMERV